MPNKGNEVEEVTAQVVERGPITIQEADPMRQWEAMLAQAQTLVRSGFLPKSINTAEKALAVMQTGKELGIGAMQSLRAIHIIDGKPTMSAELIAGLVLSRIPGAMLRVVETTEERCVVHAGRPGHEPTPFTFTMQDARQAGIASKDNWKKYPRAMLRSRCITEAARAIFPDATMGLYDADELGAITNETGEIVALPSASNASPVQREAIAAVESKREETFAAMEVDTEAKRIRIFERAKEVLQPLVPGSPRYLWAMEELFRTRDWDVVRGFSLKKLDADTRGRITQIVEQAKATPEEECTRLSEEFPMNDAVADPLVGDTQGKAKGGQTKATLIAAIRQHIEKIPEGPARLKAMENAWGKPDWAELESLSLKEIEELIAAGDVTRIVKDALEAAK